MMWGSQENTIGPKQTRVFDWQSEGNEFSESQAAAVLGGATGAHAPVTLSLDPPVAPLIGSLHQ